LRKSAGNSLIPHFNGSQIKEFWDLRFTSRRFWGKVFATKTLRHKENLIADYAGNFDVEKRFGLGRIINQFKRQKRKSRNRLLSLII
jgi:hypothetical protein